MSPVRSAPFRRRMGLALVALGLVGGHAAAQRLPVEIDRPITKVPAANDRLIVKFAPQTLRSGPTQQQILDAAAARLLTRGAPARLELGRTMGIGANTVRASRALSDAEAATVLQALSASPGVAYAELDGVVAPIARPVDTIRPGAFGALYPSQWNLHQAGAEGAWRYTRGKGVVIGIVDTGAQGHGDMPAQLPGWDFVSDARYTLDGDGRDADATDPDMTCGHGMKVASVIAARHNDVLIKGMAPDASIVPVRVMSCDGGAWSDIMDGIAWGAGVDVPGVPKNPNPAHVLNVSISSGGRNACTKAMQESIDLAVQRGVAVVVSAGNASDDASRYTPAGCRNVIVVGGRDQGGATGASSNHGAAVDVWAGFYAQVLSSHGAGYASAGGTSYASPVVSGAVAMLIANAAPHARLTPDEIEDLLKASSKHGMAHAAQLIRALGYGHALTRNVPKANLEGGGADDPVRASLLVPPTASHLRFSLTGGTGNATLVVRHAGSPASHVDCRSAQRGDNVETCSIAAPKAGTWHVDIHDESAAKHFSGATLTATYQPWTSLPVPASAQIAHAAGDAPECLEASPMWRKACLPIGTRQMWLLQASGDGFHRIVNPYTGGCLDVEGASGADGARVIDWACHNGGNQRWLVRVLKRDGDAQMTMLQAEHSGHCLSLGEPVARQRPCNIVAGTGPTLALYEPGKRRHAQVQGGSLGTGLRVMHGGLCVSHDNNWVSLGACHNKARAALMLQPVSGLSEAFVVKPSASMGRCLTTESWHDGHVYAAIRNCNGTTQQQWTLQRAGSGYQLRNVASGRCLNAKGGGSAAGTWLITWSCGPVTGNAVFDIVRN